jgi:hypothetical protein
MAKTALVYTADKENHDFFYFKSVHEFFNVNLYDVRICFSVSFLSILFLGK